MRITRTKLREWNACYSDARIAKLVPPSGLSPLEVAALEIPVQDRLWVLLRDEILPEGTLRLLACRWARRACAEAGWTDPRSLNAIDIADRHALGEATDADLAEAHAATWEAAWAAWADARASATAAAEAVAEAVRAAAWSAAWSAAVADAAAEVEAAARAAQLADVVRVLQQIDEAAKAGKEAK